MKTFPQPLSPQQIPASLYGDIAFFIPPSPFYSPRHSHHSKAHLRSISHIHAYLPHTLVATRLALLWRQAFARIHSAQIRSSQPHLLACGFTYSLATREHRLSVHVSLLLITNWSFFLIITPGLPALFQI